MHCLKCGQENREDSKFCRSCGSQGFTDKKVEGSVDLYFQQKNNTCQICGRVAPLKHIKLYENIGMFFQRQYRSIDGNLCKECIGKSFWEYTLRTLLFGWWGAISFMITPFYLLNNIFRYLFTLNMKSG